METVQARLFAAGLAPGGTAVRAHFSGDVLWLEGDGVRRSLAAARLRIRAGGFDGRQWLIEWHEADGAASLSLPPGPEGERLLAAAPAELTDAVTGQRRQRRRRGRRFALLLLLLAAAVLLPVAAAIAFLVYAQPLATWAAARVSPAQEEKLGDLAFAQLRPGLTLVSGGTAAAVVGELGARLTAGSVYRYRWVVADSPQVNAFALPGGRVVVYTGLLHTAASAEEVAGVLAHEVQHVELRHSLQNLIHALGWRAVLSLLLGDLSGGVWGGLAERLGTLAFSRDLERQADLAALAALRRAGISSQGLADFLARLAAGGDAAIPLLSSHPAGDERLQALRGAIAAQGDTAAAALPYDWRAVRMELKGASPCTIPPSSASSRSATGPAPGNTATRDCPP